MLGVPSNFGSDCTNEKRMLHCKLGKDASKRLSSISSSKESIRNIMQSKIIQVCIHQYKGRGVTKSAIL